MHRHSEEVVYNEDGRLVVNSASSSSRASLSEQATLWARSRIFINNYRAPDPFLEQKGTDRCRISETSMYDESLSIVAGELYKRPSSAISIIRAASDWLEQQYSSSTGFPPSSNSDKYTKRNGLWKPGTKLMVQHISAFQSQYIHIHYQKYSELELQEVQLLKDSSQIKLHR
jgi:hypothetical protein